MLEQESKPKMQSRQALLSPARDLEVFSRAEAMAADPLIGAEQANPVRNGLVDERLKRRGAKIFDDACDDIALATDSARNDCFAGACRAGDAIALVVMAVLSLAADKRLIDLDNAAQLGFRFDQGGSDFVTHKPSGLNRTEPHIAAKLARAHSFFAGQDQVRDLEPVAKRLVGILEDGPSDAGETVSVCSADFALPMEARRQLVDLRVAAARAFDAIWPTPRHQVGLTSIFVTNRKHGVELSRSHLVD